MRFVFAYVVLVAILIFSLQPIHSFCLQSGSYFLVPTHPWSLGQLTFLLSSIMHSKMQLSMTWVRPSFLSTFKSILTILYDTEEADNLFLVSLALGAMYILASVIEIYGIVSVSMVG